MRLLGSNWLSILLHCYKLCFVFILFFSNRPIATDVPKYRTLIQDAVARANKFCMMPPNIYGSL